MITKTIKAFSCFVFALVLTIAAVSALTVSSVPAFSNQTTFTVSDSPNTQINMTIANLPQVTFQISPVSGSTLPASGTQTYTIRGTPASDIRFGSYTTTLNVSNSNESVSQAVSFVKSFCSAGSVGTNLSIRNIDFSNSGEDDDVWQPLDEIEVEVRVENIGTEDIDDVQVELGLFDSSGRNMINDLDFDNIDEEQIDIGTVRDDDEETVIFTFTVPTDLDTDSYKLAVKAYSDDIGQSRMCDDTSDDFNNEFYQTIRVEREDEESRFILVDNIDLPTEAVCGETITGTFDIVNVGDDDQDQVLVRITGRDLAINREIEYRQDLDEGDDATLNVDFALPTNVRDGTYMLQFRTFYDYRNGVYREESEDTFTHAIRLLGCAGTPEQPGSTVDAEITADLGSEAVAGKQLVIIATITNTGDARQTFTVTSEGHDSWAKLDSVSPSRVTIAAGDSRTVTLRFTVNDDVTGTKSFTVLAEVDGEVITQDVDVEFAEASSPGFSLGGNGLIWLIVGINVLLVVLIIVVAVRLARR